MKTYKTENILKKAERLNRFSGTGEQYLKDCEDSAWLWTCDTVIYDDKALAQLKARWKPQPVQNEWEKTVEEINQLGGEHGRIWREVLEVKKALISKLSPCQKKARRKKIIQDWKKYCTSDEC